MQEPWDSNAGFYKGCLLCPSLYDLYVVLKPNACLSSLEDNILCILRRKKKRKQYCNSFFPLGLKRISGVWLHVQMLYNKPFIFLIRDAAMLL